MADNRADPRVSLAGAVLSVIGAICICTAAFSSSDDYDTLLFGIGVVSMFSASVVLFLSARSMRRGERP
jgi:bacteriorhodopsin